MINNKLMPILYLVTPMYNEEEIIQWSIDEFSTTVSKLIKQKDISEKSKILFVDDGSTDKTKEIFYTNSKENKIIEILETKHKGQIDAILHGCIFANKYSDIIVTLDVDGQDDINLLGKMIDEYKNGKEVVYAARDKRDIDSFAKKWTALFFYSILKMLKIKSIYNHAEYRLMSKNIVQKIIKISKEIKISSFRILVPFIDEDNYSVLYYDRKTRDMGSTKYNLVKLLTLAFNIIKNFLELKRKFSNFRF